MASIATSGPVSSLQWAQLIIFAVEVPIMTYNLVTHGMNGFLGWFFLQNFCLLRAIGYIILKAATDPDTVKAGGIISQVALSSLFFGFFGIWHECTAGTRHKRHFLFGRAMQIIMHLAIAAAIGIVIAGAVRAIDNSPTPNNPKPGDNLVIAGISLFIVCWIMFCFLMVALWRTPGKHNLENKLFLALAICTPLLGIRTLYSLLGAAIDNSSWGFLTGGTIAEQVVLAAVPEFIIVITLSIVGVMTRHLSKEATAPRRVQRTR